MRKLFTDVNSNARSISQSEKIGMAERNGYFKIIQNIIDDNLVFDHPEWILPKGVSLQPNSLKFIPKKTLSNIVEKICELNDIEWKPTAAKAVINFSVGDGSVLDDNWFLDVRGTESGKTSLAGVQINLMYKGGTTAHGKASIAVFSLLTRLSGGLKALKAQHRKKQELFGNRKIPKAKGTMLTDHTVFDSYVSGKLKDFDNWRTDLPRWIAYIDFLTESKVGGRVILSQFSGV